MIFRTYFDNEEFTQEDFNAKYSEQIFTQKGMLKIYWSNEIKHSKMLHLFFVPDKDTMLSLEGEWVYAMVKDDELYEADDELDLEIKESFNHIDWLYLFGKELEIQADDEEDEPKIELPYDINYAILFELGEKYKSFFDRHLGSIVVPVELSFTKLQCSKFFNPSGKEFALEYDLPLYFPFASILKIKEISQSNIGTLAYEDALKDLSKPILDFLYVESFSSNLDAQILALYLQGEDEFSDLDDEDIKAQYERMLQTQQNNVFVSLRSSPQLKADNEIVKLAIQNYNIVGFSFDQSSESSVIRATEKLQLQRSFQSKYYAKYKASLGKVVVLNNSLFDYKILVLDILNDEWCKVDLLRGNICEEDECEKANKTYNKTYMQDSSKLRLYQGYMLCKDLSRGLDFKLD